jgi:hypothetical protein
MGPPALCNNAMNIRAQKIKPLDVLKKFFRRCEMSRYLLQIAIGPVQE